MKDIRVQVNDNLHHELKLRCVQRGITMKTAVAVAIRMLIDLWKAEDERIEREKAEEADG